MKKELSKDTKEKLNYLAALTLFRNLMNMKLPRNRRVPLAKEILKKLAIPINYHGFMNLDEEYEYYSHTFTDIEAWLYEQLEDREIT